jgi:hypothetical protein
MNNMQIQSLFDSVCRCFGHSPTNSNSNSPNGVEGVASAASQPMVDGASQSSVKRRTNRLELKDKQWDELFDKKKQQQQQKQQSTVTTTSAVRRQSSSAAAATANDENENDLTIAHAVAQAKLAANPPRYTRSTSKRKRSAKSREEIFRSKHNVPPTSAAETKASSTPFSRLIHPSLALCFATPIRGTEEEPEETELRSLDNSDTNTLNTCEDTITSTVYFENKLSHIEETRPPMPLFNQFKLGHQKDEIRNIMETDSHSSLNMIRLLQQQQQEQQQQQQQQQRTQPMPLEESSSDSHEESRRNKQRRNTDHEMEDVPDVKAVSSSTDSSRQSQSHHALHEA